MSSQLSKAKAAKASPTTPKPKITRSFFREILHPVTQNPLCKCMCRTVTEQELITALQFKIAALEAELQKSGNTSATSTSPGTPTTIAPVLVLNPPPTTDPTTTTTTTPKSSTTTSPTTSSLSSTASASEASTTKVPSN